MKKDNSISKKQLDRKKEKEGIAGDISTQGRVQIRRSSLNIGWAMKVEKNKSAYIIKDVSPEEWREEYRNFESALTFKAQTCRVCRITIGTVTYIGMVPYVLR